MTRLSEVPLGDGARVVAIDGSDEIAVRLLEMGITPGQLVRVVGMAPLGDPWELELRGYRLSVRKTEAARILVESG